MTEIQVSEGRSLVFVATRRGTRSRSEDPSKYVTRLISSARSKIDGDSETALLEYALLRGNNSFHLYRILTDSGYGEAAKQYIMATKGWTKEVYDRAVEMFNSF